MIDCPEQVILERLFKTFFTLGASLFEWTFNKVASTGGRQKGTMAEVERTDEAIRYFERCRASTPTRAN